MLRGRLKCLCHRTDASVTKWSMSLPCFRIAYGSFLAHTYVMTGQSVTARNQNMLWVHPDVSRWPWDTSSCVWQGARVLRARASGELGDAFFTPRGTSSMTRSFSVYKTEQDLRNTCEAPQAEDPSGVLYIFSNFLNNFFTPRLTSSILGTQFYQFFPKCPTRLSRK